MSEQKFNLKNFGFGKKTESASQPAVPNPKDVKKRWLFVGMGLVGTALVISTITQEEPRAPVARESKEEKLLDLNPSNSGEKSWQQQSLSELEQVKRNNEELQRSLDALKKQVNEKDSPPLASPQLGSESVPSLPGGVVPPPVPQFEVPTPVVPVVPGTTSQGPGVPAGIPPGILPPDVSSMGGDVPMVYKPKAIEKKTGDDKLSGAGLPASGQQDTVLVREEYKKNPFSGFLPAGAFATVALLHGVDAGTSVSTQSNPQPLLLNVQANAQLPGSQRYKIKSCFMLASVYGDLSSERVFGRLSSLSCMDSKDKLVLSQPIQGYIVDSDGVLGLRGKIEDRQGARMAKSLLAGFAQGLSGALGNSLNGPTGLASGLVQGATGSDAVRQAGLSGAQNAMNQLAEFYLAEAKSVFPVITVPSGRTATIVITQGAALNWNDGSSQFTREVKPVNN